MMQCTQIAVLSELTYISFFRIKLSDGKYLCLERCIHDLQNNSGIVKTHTNHPTNVLHAGKDMALVRTHSSIFRYPSPSPDRDSPQQYN